MCLFICYVYVYIYIYIVYTCVSATRRSGGAPPAAERLLQAHMDICEAKRGHYLYVRIYIYICMHVYIYIYIYICVYGRLRGEKGARAQLHELAPSA